MWHFTALINAVFSPLSYLSRSKSDPASKDAPHACEPNLDEFDPAFSLDLTLRPPVLRSTVQQSGLLEPPQPKYDTATPSLMSGFPYLLHPTIPGWPIRFHVGNHHKHFDVHSAVLATASPAFEYLLSKPLEGPVTLLSVSQENFKILIKWLYNLKPPRFNRPDDLLALVQLWTTAAGLGFWRKANTLMRLGMEAMFPATAKCYIGVVRWVFANTPASSPLRDYIIAIFTQRSEFDESVFLTKDPKDSEIWSKVTDFMKKLHLARRVFARGKVGSAWSVDANGLPVFDWEVARDWKPGQEEFPLPPYLVWDENAVDVPDCFFIHPGTAAYEDSLVQVLKTNG